MAFRRYVSGSYPNKPYEPKCLVTGVQLGMLSATNAGAIDMTNRLGSMPFAWIEYGKHPNDEECRTEKVVPWEVLAALYAQIGLIRQSLPVDQRDQFDAEVRHMRKVAEG